MKVDRGTFLNLTYHIRELCHQLLLIMISHFLSASVITLFVTFNSLEYFFLYLWGINKTNILCEQKPNKKYEYFRCVEINLLYLNLKLFQNFLLLLHNIHKLFVLQQIFCRRFYKPGADGKRSAADLELAWMCNILISL